MTGLFREWVGPVMICQGGRGTARWRRLGKRDLAWQLGSHAVSKAGSGISAPGRDLRAVLGGAESRGQEAKETEST